MTIDRYDQRTGIKNVLVDDIDMIKNLFNKYTVTGSTGITEGLLSAWQDFMAFYLNDPRNLFSGLKTTGSTGDVYKVRYQDGDLPGFLKEKLKAIDGNGIIFNVSGTSNKIIDIELDINESDSSTSIYSFLKNGKTLKKPVGGEGITLSQNTDELTINADDEKVKTSSSDNSNGYLENKVIAGTNVTIDKYVDGLGNEALQINSGDPTSGVPGINIGDAGKKIVVKQDETGYELVAASTTSGFNDKDAQALSFDDSTRTLTITPTNTSFDITNSKGFVYNKATETIVIPDVNGLHGVYYNDNGVLEVFTNENRSQLYNRMLISTTVSFVSWSVSSQKNNFVTKVIKDRSMSNATFAKNAFDKEIYRLTGLDSYDLNLEQTGDLDSHAQFGITAGSALWTDDEHLMALKPTGSNYKVYYKDVMETRFIEKTGFSCLNTIDFGLGDGRVVFNNNGVPTEVNNNDFVWYVIGITNDIEESRKIVSFMGQNEYTSRASANLNRDDEINIIEKSFGLRQEFSSIYAVLFQTGDGKSNAVHASIEDFYLISKDGQVLSGGGTVPDDLINGSDASYLHNHDSLYSSEIENIITVGKADTIDSDVDFNTITDALNSVQPLATPTILVYKGVYEESLASPNIPIVGIGNQGDVIIDGNHLVDNGDCFLTNLTLTNTTTVDNSYTLRVTSDGNLFYRDLLVVDNYTGEIQTTGIRIEGNSYIRGDILQIQMKKTGTNNGTKNIIGLDAPNLSSNILSINNSISISHYSEDINDNLIGINYGGNAGNHTSNMIFEAITTNINYTGNIKPIVYNNDTTPKTFGDMTVRVDDAGAGTLTVFDVQATSGLFQASNVNAFYNGNGTAYLTNVNAGAELHIGSYVLTGFTSVKTGLGLFHSFGMIDDIFNITVDTNLNNKNIKNVNTINPEGELTTFGGDVYSKTHKIGVNGNIFNGNGTNVQALDLAYNIKYDNGYKLINDGEGFLAESFQGVMSYYTAPTGIAGDTPALTKHMAISEDGVEIFTSIKSPTINSLITSEINYCALGDSITNGVGSTTGSYSYANILADNLNFSSFTKLAKNGCSCKDNSPYEVLNDQVNLIPVGTNLITLMIGVNDWLLGSPLGNTETIINKDFTTLVYDDTFAEALRKNIETILINFPNAKLYVLTPLKVAPNQTGLYDLREYISVIYKICNFLAVPIINTGNSSGIWYNSSFYFDGLHPNSDGYQKIYEVVRNGLISNSTDSNFSYLTINDLPSTVLNTATGLAIDGSNANTTVDIGNYSFSSKTHKIGTNGNIFNGNGTFAQFLDLAYNIEYDNGYKLINDGVGLLQEVSNSRFDWYYAQEGNAGDPAVITQLASLDGSTGAFNVNSTISASGTITGAQAILSTEMPTLGQVEGLVGDYVKKSGDIMTGGLQVTGGISTETEVSTPYTKGTLDAVTIAQNGSLIGTGAVNILTGSVTLTLNPATYKNRTIKAKLQVSGSFSLINNSGAPLFLWIGSDQNYVDIIANGNSGAFSGFLSFYSDGVNWYVES